MGFGSDYTKIFKPSLIDLKTQNFKEDADQLGLSIQLGVCQAPEWLTN